MVQEPGTPVPTAWPETRRRHWYGIAPDPVLPPISTRRAYAEVLLVYLAFFAVGIVAAALLLGNRTDDVKDTGSWGIYMSAVVNVAAEIGLAAAVVLLLAARRGVRPADLGLRVPRLPDGRLAVSQTIRITAWCFFAIIVGGIINSALQTGHLPTQHTSAPELIYAVFGSLQAGVVEELVVLAFVVVTLRQAGRPWWEVTTVAFVLRGAYHVYYGPGVIGILVWAALFYWIFLRFRQLLPLMACHVLWDAVAFLSRANSGVAAVGGLLVLVLWVTAGILWLVERGDRKGPPYAGAYGWPGDDPNVMGRQPRPGPAGYRYPDHGVPVGAAGNPTAANGGGAPGPGAHGPSAPGPVAPGPPPGWHPDPAGQNRWRWWDGYRWTEHVSSHS